MNCPYEDEATASARPKPALRAIRTLCISPSRADRSSSGVESVEQSVRLKRFRSQSNGTATMGKAITRVQGTAATDCKLTEFSAAAIVARLAAVCPLAKQFAHRP